MWKAPAMPPNAGSSAWVELNEDGTVTVSVGGQEIGQGRSPCMAQMAAAALGVPYEWVRVATPVDTEVQPVRMADRGQPPDLEHGQCGESGRARCAASKSWRWSPRPGTKTSTTWISSTAR